MYKCPFCDFKVATISSLKKHMERLHFSDECPICHKKYRNVLGHFHNYMKINGDPYHMLLFYLYSRRRLSQKEKQKVGKLLETVTIKVKML